MSATDEVTRPTSPAYLLLAHVWEHGGIGRSRQRWEAAIGYAVRLAITAELEWGEDDLVWLRGAASRWARRGVGYGASERDYTIACTFRGGPSLSFCLAFERMKNRPPFILRTPDNKSGTRLSVGEMFKWEGERVKVTSFADDGQSLVACSYQPTDPDNRWGPTKIKRRYTITVAEIRELGRANIEAGERA